jgi:hypothetical protein
MERDVVMEEEDEQASGAVLIEDVEDFLVDMGTSVDVAQDEGDQEVRSMAKTGHLKAPEVINYSD